MGPRILVSNDDGVVAPGLRALAHLLHQNKIEFSVCGPAGERSAQSHSITVGKHMHAFNIEVEGASEAYAVDGTPADSVMLALYAPLLSNNQFDLVVSGINRGDNAGLHVIYSGTVGAAREAACKDVPALAFSLDDHTARTEDQYEMAAQYAVAIIKATLGLYNSPLYTAPLKGHVVNVNFPGSHHRANCNNNSNGNNQGMYKGFYLCHQGQHCSFPDFKEVEADAHFPKTSNDRHHHSNLVAGNVVLRAFRNAAGYLRTDVRQGTDSWAMYNGWVAVTLIGLTSDIPLSTDEAIDKMDNDLVVAVNNIMHVAGKELGVEVNNSAFLNSTDDVRIKDLM